MTRYIAGWFHDRETAERAITELESVGFDSTKMGMLLAGSSTTAVGNNEPFIGKDMPMNAARGAAAGGAAGATGGALLATVGATLIPGIGPLLAGGVLGAILIGGGGGALTGGTLAGMFPSFGQEDYENRLREGNVLVLVEADQRKDEVARIFSTFRAASVREMDLNRQDIQNLHNPQDTAAVAEHTMETPAQGLANSKAYLAGHPEEAERLWGNEPDTTTDTTTPKP